MEKICFKYFGFLSHYIDCHIDIVVKPNYQHVFQRIKHGNMQNEDVEHNRLFLGRVNVFSSCYTGIRQIANHQVLAFSHCIPRCVSGKNNSVLKNAYMPLERIEISFHSLHFCLGIFLLFQLLFMSVRTQKCLLPLVVELQNTYFFNRRINVIV